jgi:hypothetical protein
MLHIVVAFRESDLALLSKQLNKKCILISDVLCKEDVAKQIRPQLNLNKELELSSKVKKLFELAEVKYGIDSLSGFANNFYECSVAPICNYLEVLDDLLKDLNKSQTRVEVWFPAKFLFKPKYSSYFMAEHESQGQRLYSREAVFFPYLEEICEKNKAIIKYKKIKLGIKSYIEKKIRVAAVMSWRLISGARKGYLKVKKNQSINKESIELIAVTRSKSQTEFLIPFLLFNRINTAFITGEVSLRKGLNRDTIKKISNQNKEIKAIELKIKISELIFNYIHALWLMVKKSEMSLITNGVQLNMDQAMTEILAMWPDLKSYRDGLYREVKNIGLTSGKILLSTEQKSPHAYADAWVAAKCGLICIHLMQCEQIARPLPIPIAGDIFLADSILNVANFARAWREDYAKVKYIGSFKSGGNNNNNNNIGNIAKKRICFFSAADDTNANKMVLHLIRELVKNIDTAFIVKLHPRDSKVNYKDYDEFIFYEEGDIEKSELYDNFDYAITFASGVVMDLMFANKPLMLLRFGKWATDDVNYSDVNYFGNIKNIMQLKKVIKSPAELELSFKRYREHYFEKNNFIENFEDIWNNMQEIVKAKSKNTFQHK